MAKKPEKKKTIANLDQRECRWPIGDPRDADFHFCGAPQASLLCAPLGHGVRAVEAAPSASRAGPPDPARSLTERRRRYCCLRATTSEWEKQ
jgi:hypothetical protein